MMDYRHDEDDVFVACFGRKKEEFLSGTWTVEEWWRLVVLCNVLDFWEKLGERDRFIVKVLLGRLGVVKLSQLVELVEGMIAVIAGDDVEEVERVAEMFVDEMVKKVDKLAGEALSVVQ